MGDPIVTNGVYLMGPDGTRIPLRKEVMTAFKKFIDGRLNGSVLVHFKKGGIASVEDRTMYQDSTQ